jgi:pyruvate,water dikinase
LLERKIGQKETAIWLADGGGTYENPAPGRSRACLSDDEALALTDLLVQVERLYDKPIDIEWAVAGGELFLLQARPITAYFPLPERLLTAPGEQKRLYGDLTLAKWGMQEPLSVMGTDFLRIINHETLKATMGDDLGLDVVDMVRPTTAGRTYVDVSFTLKMRGKQGLVDFWRPLDILGAETIASLDVSEYVPKKLPPPLRGLAFKMIRQNLGMIGSLLRALKDPAEYKRVYFEEEARMKRDLADMEDASELSLEEYAVSTMARMVDYAKVFGAGMAAAELARSRISKMFERDEAEVQERVAYLGRALPNNVTIEMGLDMYCLACSEEIISCKSGEEFARRLEGKSFSPQFLQAWDELMTQFGFRGPMEMDVAAPRLCERPEQLYAPLRSMAEHSDDGQNPQAVFEQAEAQRGEAYRALLEVASRKGKRKARRFEKHYQTLVELGGLRERPKYFVALLTDMFRRRVLGLAQPLVAAGRLDNVQQAFDLSMDEFERALVDPSLDLRALAERNTRFVNRLRRMSELPRVVDSRGKILRPPKREAREGELLGEPISPGTAQGRIKVLREPDEKPVRPGEILVARVTDPGWTPLFINAAAIILEVGGMLQHGALVAREYGKPCVSGIENATEALADGQLVEVDGSSGLVRLV